MRSYSHFLLFLIGLAGLLSVSACRKKVNLFASEEERQRLKEQAEDLFAMQRDRLGEDNDLLYFELQGQVSRTRFNNSGDSLFVVVKRPDYLSATDRLRINDLLVSDGAVSKPDMGDEVDVSKPFPIEVTAPNGQKRKYIVSVSFTQESGNEILQFVLQGQDKRRNPTKFDGDKIIVYLDKYQQNGLNLNLDILKISPDATINKGQGQVQNYCNIVDYEVTSESGKKRTYHVYVYMRFQLPDHNFETWYSTNFISGRAHSGYYMNLGKSAGERLGWASFNDGYYAITGRGYWNNFFSFPVDRFVQQGKSYLSLTTQEYQNTATAGQDFPFGISPGVVFTGKLQNYDATGGVSGRSYKRGTMKLEPIDLGLGCAKVSHPKSFSFMYQYKPGQGKRKSYNQNCRYWWNWRGFFEGARDCNQDVEGKDSMELSVLLLDKNNKIVGVGGFRDVGKGYFTKQTVTFHYDANNLNLAEKQLISNYYNNSNGNGNWSNDKEHIAKALVIITASHGLWAGPNKSPVGAKGSQLRIDDLIMEY